MTPGEAGLLSPHLVAGYPGHVNVADQRRKEAAVARLLASEDLRPVILSPGLAEGVFAKLYRHGPHLRVAVCNSTEAAATRSCVLQPEGPAGPTYACTVQVPAKRSVIAPAQLAD